MWEKAWTVLEKSEWLVILIAALVSLMHVESVLFLVGLLVSLLDLYPLLSGSKQLFPAFFTIKKYYFQCVVHIKNKHPIS